MIVNTTGVFAEAYGGESLSILSELELTLSSWSVQIEPMSRDVRNDLLSGPRLGLSRGTMTTAWDTWPKARAASIPWMDDLPPFSQQHSPRDRDWLNATAADLRDRFTDTAKANDCVRRAKTVTQHVAREIAYATRVLQTYFRNPIHGNLANPFLESLFILLTWRSRISTAQLLLSEILERIPGPAHVLDRTSHRTLREIVARVGFTEKRPAMVEDLIAHFVFAFPDGNLTKLRRMSDDDVLDFLTAIDGIGRKSAICVLMYSLGRDRFPVDTHVRRVLARSGLISSLKELDPAIGHRAFQQEAERCIPPSCRRALHAGLVALGQSHCKPQRPKCSCCPIRKVCKHYRQSEQLLAEGRRLTHVELFCGTGGFGAGFGSEGFRTVVAVDNDRQAVTTYRLNHSAVPAGNVFQEDVSKCSPSTIRPMMERWRNDLQRNRIDVITAGLPCQGFSKAGYRSRPSLDYDVHTDPRNLLYKSLMAWVRQLRPKYVVVENVPGLRSAGVGPENILNRVQRALRRLKYEVDYSVVDASWTGLPQRRRRLILIASRHDVRQLEVSEIFPRDRNDEPLVSAIGDLPPVGANEGRWYGRFADRVVTGHRARFHNSDDLEIIRLLKPGQRYSDFVDSQPALIARRAANGRAVYSTKSFADKFAKLLANKPSRTIVAHLERDGNGYIHPNQDRSLTPREAARIQGFPDDFCFTGSQGHQFIQTGNAFPPPLARAIAQAIVSSLGKD